MLNLWTQKSGSSLGTFQERTKIDIGLPTTFENTFDDSTNLNFKVITGSLPPGLRISEGRIIGTAFEVSRDTDFKFVVRAEYNSEFSDRTFVMTISGADQPQWNTLPGPLPLGPNDAYYVLDSSYIDFQLQVIDFDISAGQELKFFIPTGGGELPPGLILTDTGRIVGWVQPVLAPPLIEGDGYYDQTVYDKLAYDYGLRPNNGYDTWIFDSVNFDFGVVSLPPRKLNRNFEFNVIVTDGDSSIARKFRIYVVGDDFFRADNTATSAGNGVFTADVTYARAPIWTTPANLGLFRANNYKTFKLDTYEGLLLGPVSYSLESVNPDIFGVAFTTLRTENRSRTNKIRLKNVKGTPIVGHKLQLSDYVTGASFTIYTITEVVKLSETDYLLTISGTLEITIPEYTNLYFGTVSTLPPGMTFDPTTAEVFGVLPYQTAITKDYRFTIKAIRYTEKAEIASAKRTFTATIIGEIDSTITWITDSDLGGIGANYVSTLNVTATTTLVNSPLLFFLISGSLPPGLSLNYDGEIIGKVNQYGTEDSPGLITFEGEDLLFDGGDTSFDRLYTFTIESRDVLKYSASTKTFNLRVTTPNDRLYSNLTVRPFLKQTQRDLFRSFINNPDVWDITSIYRPNDPNFGIQKDLKMLVYAGIETKSAAEVVGVVGRSHAPKRFKLGSVKKARADIEGTREIVYEVVYLEVFDPLEIGKKYLPSPTVVSPSTRKITIDQTNQFYNGDLEEINPFWDRPDPFYASVDRNDLFAGDSASELRYPNSISNWRNRIKTLGIKDFNYLPLWMRSIQDGSVQPLGYVKAIPLCYCKPGTADDIILNIKNSQFDFKQIDYVIDRYIIDSVTNYGQDKYIVFKNDRTSIT
jgi:hypothetical protein